MGLGMANTILKAPPPPEHGPVFPGKVGAQQGIEKTGGEGAPPRGAAQQPVGQCKKAAQGALKPQWHPSRSLHSLGPCARAPAPGEGAKGRTGHHSEEGARAPRQG